MAIKTATKQLRTISADTMTSIVEFVPMDGFKLTPEILNQQYKVTDVATTEFNGRPSVMVTLQNDEHVLNISLNALKKARVLGEDIPEDLKKFKDTEHVYLRSEAQSMWNKSKYMYAAAGMKKDEEFIIPEELFLSAAIIAEDRETEQPVVNPFNFKDYGKVVKEYQKRDEFPTFQDFKEELAKSGDSRIIGLTEGMVEPVLFSYVKEEINDYRHNLVFKDFTAEGE